MALSVFPVLPGLAWPVTRSAVPDDTIENDALSGKRARFGQWTYGIYRYQLKFNVLRSANAFAELQTLAGFVQSVRGKTQLWQYDDPNDDSATAQGFGVGDGVHSAFQLVRAYGGWTEPVYLVNGAPQIFVAGVLKTAGTDYTISAYGVVTFTTPPGNGAALTWTGNFFWPCRFDDSAFAFLQNMAGFFKLEALKFSTEKLP